MSKNPWDIMAISLDMEKNYANLQFWDVFWMYINIYIYNGISLVIYNNIISWDYFWDVFIVVFDAEGR